MIDFKATSQDSNGIVEYYNENGEVVKRYQFSDIYKWVESVEDIDTSSEAVSESDFEPMGKDKEFFGDFYGWKLNKMIDDNWISYTTLFFNHKNQ